MKIDGTDITMISGNSEGIIVGAKDVDGSKYPFATGDIVYFTVKRIPNDESPILQKTITEFIDGDAVIYLNPEDTAEMNGNYTYDIKIKQQNGKETTLYDPSRFEVIKGVTA